MKEYLEKIREHLQGEFAKNAVDYLGSAEKADFVFNGRLIILTSHVRPR